MTPKRYNSAYFHRWYHSGHAAATTAAALSREVALAIAITEQLLGRTVNSVLDVGAGEGRWQPVIARLRPRCRYAGVDGSRWAVAKWGRRRNIRLGTFDDLPALGLDAPFDLIVAADVLHYLDTPSLRRALNAMVPMVGGIAWLPTFTIDDDIVGDRVEFQHRTAADYRRLFRRAGLQRVGLHAYVTAGSAIDLSSLEQC